MSTDAERLEDMLAALDVQIAARLAVFSKHARLKREERSEDDIHELFLAAREIILLTGLLEKTAREMATRIASNSGVPLETIQQWQVEDMRSGSKLLARLAAIVEGDA